MQWSTSMVYTPTGWTGWVDVYLPKLQTFYVPVYPTVPTAEQMEQAGSLITPELKEYADVLRNEFKIITRGEERDEFTPRAPRSQPRLPGAEPTYHPIGMTP